MHHKVPADLPATLLPLVIAEDNYFPAGIVEKDLNNFGPRLGMGYQERAHAAAIGIRAVFRQPESQRAAVHVVPPFSGRYDASPTGTMVNVADLYPDPRLAATFPTPFSMNPDNVSAYVRQWNVNVQRTFGREYIVEVAYTGSQSRHEHKRFNSISRPRARRRRRSVCRPAVCAGLVDIERYRTRRLQRDLRPRRQTLLRRAVLHRQLPVLEEQDNNSGEIEANDTAFAWDHDADWALSRYDRTHRSSISFGYDLPWGIGKRWLSEPGIVSRLLGDWQLSGAVRMQSGVPFSSR